MRVTKYHNVENNPKDPNRGVRPRIRQLLVGMTKVDKVEDGLPYAEEIVGWCMRDPNMPELLEFTAKEAAMIIPSTKPMWEALLIKLKNRY